ncbi:MAG: hypothetical protein ACI91G_000143 [Gammaproteobacteria bacterium]|jgi:hypothetical protein
MANFISALTAASGWINNGGGVYVVVESKLWNNQRLTVPRSFK